jgi:AcrR family transcriptional regulator
VGDRARRKASTDDVGGRDDPRHAPSRSKGTTRRKVTFPVSEADLSPTARRLLEAAQRVLEKSGYHALSYESIGREAGLSPGLIRYHFGSKSELLVALSDWIVFRDADSQARPAQPPVLTRVSGVETLIGYAESVLANLESYALYFNLLPHLFDNEHGRAQLAELFASNLDMATAAFAVDPGADSYEEYRLLASMTAALSDGLAIQLIIDPSSASIEKALSRWREYLDWTIRRHCPSQYSDPHGAQETA